MKPPKKEEILLNLTAQNNYSVEDATLIIQTIYDFVQRLTSTRDSNTLTISVLTELDCMPDKDMRAIKHWLIETIKSDSTFKYAYNHLAVFWNRDPGAFFLYDIIDISVEQLDQLIASELKAQKKDKKPNQKDKLTNDELKNLKESLKEYVNYPSIPEFNKTIDALNESKMLLGNNNLEFAAGTLILYKAFCKKTVEFNFWLSSCAKEMNRSYTNYKPANAQLTEKTKIVKVKYPFLDNLS